MNFALILFIALAVTGGIWLLDALVLKRSRAKGAREPLLVEYAKSFFPVILVVFTLRSLLIGDFILVNKYTYGIRLPVINKKIIPLNTPERGDVMVFRYPADPSLDYIKRVIGVPGDVVEYRNKQLIINGKPVPSRTTGSYSYVGNGLNYITAKLDEERLNGTGHAMMTEPDKPAVYPTQVMDFPHRENCSYNADGEGFVCKVPEGQYFMMGDNRDASNDSRYWGFVPDRNIVGKAFFIWMNFDDLGRIGTTIK